MAAISDLVAQSRDAADRDRTLDAELRFLDESEDKIGAATVLECLSANLMRAGHNFITYD